jgi:hypothetical protein
MWSMTAFGGVTCLYAAYHFPLQRLNFNFFLLVAFTICIGSRLSVKIPRVNGEITVSDTFIFLALLMYGGEAATLLGAAEAFCSSRRFSKKRRTHCFNSGVMGLSTFLTALAMRLCFGDILPLQSIGYTTTFVLAISLMAFVQYATNSGLVAIAVALQSEKSLWTTWQQNFLYTSITYFAGASAASIIAQLI